MRSKLFYGAGSEYRSQRDQDIEHFKVWSEPWQYDPSDAPHYNFKPSKTKADRECRYCGKLHRYAQNFCSITCTRGFIKAQQRKGTFADD